MFSFFARCFSDPRPPHRLSSCSSCFSSSSSFFLFSPEWQFAIVREKDEGNPQFSSLTTNSRFRIIVVHTWGCKETRSLAVRLDYRRPSVRPSGPSVHPSGVRSTIHGNSSGLVLMCGWAAGSGSSGTIFLHLEYGSPPHRSSPSPPPPPPPLIGNLIFKSDANTKTDEGQMLFVCTAMYGHECNEGRPK